MSKFTKKCMAIRTLSRNPHYIIAFENPRHQLGIRSLLRQAFPTCWRASHDGRVSRSDRRTTRYTVLADFFVAELQIFCRGQIWLKFVWTSACRTLADFLSRLTAFRLWAESTSAMLEKMLVHVTLMTIPH